MNLAGVQMIVELQNELDRMRERMERMSRELDATRRRVRQENEPAALVLYKDVQRPWRVVINE